MRFFKNFKFEEYIKILKRTRCLVGNSSSGIRDCGFIGTPVVNIGSRQNSREQGENVLNVEFEKSKIVKAISFQLKKDKYKRNNIYGNGDAAIKIVNFLKNVKNISIQKKLMY